MSVRDILETTGALRFGTFELSSGRTSSYYVDVKEATTEPAALRELADALAERVPDDAEAVACVALGGVPLGVAVSLRTGLDLVVVRKQAKGHGTEDRIVGDAARRLVLVEDVTTTGASAVDAVQVLREAGATVEDCLVVVDRDEGAHQALADVDVTLTPLIEADEIVEDTT